jgi:putative glutamine amidotransferase
MRPLIAVTGRRLGPNTTRWPYANAAALPRPYFDAVRRSGGEPVLLDPAPITPDEADALLARFDALLLSGGPDLDPAGYGETARPETYGVDPVADDFETTLTLAAIQRSSRTLAICRGIQVLNVALGGNLYQHIADEPGVAPHGRPGEVEGQLLHEVRVEERTLLAQVLGKDEARCSCHHHQALSKLGDGLRVTARSADGIVEGVELDGTPLLAVQWHPEDTAGDDPVQQRLFDWLCLAEFTT